MVGIFGEATKDMTLSRISDGLRFWAVLVLLVLWITVRLGRDSLVAMLGTAIQPGVLTV